MLSTTAPVVIAGGGVIGVAVARELSRRGIPALLVEAQRLASGASGRAAGLLTPPPSASWDEPLGALLRRSFQMHLDLATHLPADSGIDYGLLPLPLPARRRDGGAGARPPAARRRTPPATAAPSAGSMPPPPAPSSAPWRTPPMHRCAAHSWARPPPSSTPPASPSPSSAMPSATVRTSASAA